jgi:hypothetical protein
MMCRFFVYFKTLTNSTIIQFPYLYPIEKAYAVKRGKNTTCTYANAYDFLLAYMHDINVTKSEYHEFIHDTPFEDVAKTENDTSLIKASQTSSQGFSLPGDIRGVM